MRIDKKYWDCIMNLAAFTTRQRLPFNKLVDAMRIMGYEPYEKEPEADDMDWYRIRMCDAICEKEERK